MQLQSQTTVFTDIYYQADVVEVLFFDDETLDGEWPGCCVFNLCRVVLKNYSGLEQVFSQIGLLLYFAQRNIVMAVAFSSLCLYLLHHLQHGILIISMYAHGYSINKDTNQVAYIIFCIVTTRNDFGEDNVIGAVVALQQ